MTNTEGGALPVGLDLVRGDDGSVRLINKQIDTWLVSFAPASVDLDRRSVIPRPPLGTALGLGLTAAAPALAEALRGIGGLAGAGDLIVRFAPEIRQRLADGTLHLMESATGALPTAVGPNGIAGNARVVGEAAAGAAAGGGLLAAGTAALPFVLGGAAAMAATWSHQRWLEKSFRGLEQSLAKIETRMRDDDHGQLEAADRLVQALGERAMTGALPSIVQNQLADAHQRTEAIYFSRLRYVQRFIDQVDEWSTAHEVKHGTRTAWTSELTNQLSKSGDTTVEELVVFFKALLVRGRTTASIAAAVTAEGDPGLAIRLIDDLQESTRVDYFAAHNRLRALARAPQEPSRLRRLAEGAPDALKALVSGDAQSPYEVVSSLARNLDEGIGSRLPDRDDPVELLLPM